MSLENKENTFKILIASDIHLGYQHDRNKGELLYDSFVTFEEILQYAKQYKVDFILLGGDLFHDPKPSQAVLVECMDILRKYCFGPGNIKIEFLTNPDVAFEHCRHKSVNYEDPNININIPVFTIHGNHDNPIFSSVGSIDILSVSGLVNYFGKCTNLEKITVEPILLKKGTSHIALYGLSHINDRRLNRLISHNKIELKQPKDLPEECMNILVLHQNRVQHTYNDYVPETKLPSFLDLVIWGHEHECRIAPEPVPGHKFHVSQPGSSIATSLSESEAVPKHIGLLWINESRFKMKKLKLNTVRPFVFDTIPLFDNPDIENKKDEESLSTANAKIISEYIDSYIEETLIPKAMKQLTGHPKQPQEPLIRLRLLYKDPDDVFETAELSQKYCDKVANPMNLILFRKVAKTSTKPREHSTADAPLDDLSEEFQFTDDDEKGWTQTVQGNIKEYFEEEEHKDLLTVLSVTELNETLNQYIAHGDEDVIQDVIENKISKLKEYIKGQNLEKTEDIEEKIKEYRDKMDKAEEEQRQEVINFLNNRSSKTRTREIYNMDENEDISIINDNSDNDNDKSSKNVIKGGSTRGRGKAGTRGRNARGSKANVMSKSNTDDVDLSSRTRMQSKEKQSQKEQSTLQPVKGSTSLNRTRGPSRQTFLDYSDSD